MRKRSQSRTSATPATGNGRHRGPVEGADLRFVVDAEAPVGDLLGPLARLLISLAKNEVAEKPENGKG